MTRVEQRTPVQSAAEFGRVAVMLGGHSSERDVSLASGQAVLAALQQRGVDAHAWNPAQTDWRTFIDAGFDRVWNALHGTGGEDGALQGALEWLGVPYTGSGVTASAVAMDKICSKHVFQAGGIPTPAYRVIHSVADAGRAADELGLPLVIKPACEGSSVGMSIVRVPDELAAGAARALEFAGPAIAEAYVSGAELTISVLQGEALPAIRIETPREFYDYAAKYESDETRYICPGIDDAEQAERFAAVALAAFNEIGARGWGRVDFMTGPGGEPLVLEINTVPGMTSHSLVPMAAREAGIEFDELCWRVLETSMRASRDQATAEVAANGA